MPLNPLKSLNRHLQGLIAGRLWLKILIGMVVGVAVGIALGPEAGLIDSETSDVIGSWLALPGRLFLALIQMIVIPLVFASIVLGIASNEDLQELKRMGPWIALFFLVMTTIAIVMGMGATSLIKPGAYIEQGIIEETVGEAEGADQSILDAEAAERPTLKDLPGKFIKLLPENPLSAMAGSEMLQVVLFAIIFGMALTALTRHKVQALLEPLNALQEVCLKVVKWAMMLAPVAVFGLLAQITAKIGIQVLIGMGIYVGTVLLGLLLLLALYLVVVGVLSGVSPWAFAKDIGTVQLLAFSTSSSAAVMPTSIEVAENKLGVGPSISNFVIPLGATINMSGTALYQGAATIFLAQVFGVELGIGSLALIVVTAVGASIGTPSTPGVGIIVLATILRGAGIPLSGIALIIGVDRILDMSRTAVNVTGDLSACVVMERWFGKPKKARLPAQEAPETGGSAVEPA